MKKISKNTINAIQKHLDNGETRFFIGAYYYEANVNGMIRRCEQKPGYAPTSDWQLVGRWSCETNNWKIVEVI